MARYIWLAQHLGLGVVPAVLLVKLKLSPAHETARGNQCPGPLWSVAWCTKGDTFPGDMRGATLSLRLAGVWSGHEKHLVGLLVKLLDELIDRPKLHDAGEAVVYAGRQFSSCRALCAEIAQGSRGRNLVPIHCLLIDLPRSLIKHADAPCANAESMLLLAGDLAGLTSCAELVVNQKSVSHISALLTSRFFQLCR